VDGQPASAHNLPALNINRLITPIKPVYSEPLSVTVPVVISTCTLLVGMVESVPVPPQCVKVGICFIPKMNVIMDDFFFFCLAQNSLK